MLKFFDVKIPNHINIYQFKHAFFMSYYLYYANKIKKCLGYETHERINVSGKKKSLGALWEILQNFVIYPQRTQP